MKVFLDTNIVIDFLSHREPHYQAAALIMMMAESGKCDFCMCSMSVHNIFYILHHAYGFDIEAIYEKVSALFAFLGITDLTADNVLDAVCRKEKDIEDCMQYISAEQAGADVIVTRNKKDFSGTILPVMTPDDFLDKYYQ